MTKQNGSESNAQHWARMQRWAKQDASARAAGKLEPIDIIRGENS
jgi:hypothetical protein